MVSETNNTVYKAKGSAQTQLVGLVLELFISLSLYKLFELMAGRTLFMLFSTICYHNVYVKQLVDCS